MKLLELIPEGWENAITREELKLRTGRNDRDIRKEIKRLRVDHVILNLQDGRGYFRPRPDRPEEMELVKLWDRQESKRSAAAGQSTRGAKLLLAVARGEECTVVRQHIRRKHRQVEPPRQLEGQTRLNT